MKLLEVKNNLVKLSYEEGEYPVLGRFIVLASQERSYVAQFVNLKSDHVHNFAIGRLLFTFNQEGVVDDYDGSVPDINSQVSLLDSSELLDILPIETPVQIGNLAQQENMLKLDISMFEHNLAVFSEQNIDKTCFISNCVRQLFQLKEKSVIIDTEDMFEGYPKIVFSKDFKLPLNAEAIDFLFEYELSEIDVNTKAVIQDIFYNVQEYIKTLNPQFLPIDSFVNVVAAQYKETGMPELALLKNKLLKYRDSNVFANTKEEFLALSELIDKKNCSIIDIKDIPEALQCVVTSFIHSELNKFDKYIYLFAPLSVANSNKKLLKQFINNNHVFTTVLVSSSYKYAQELKENAQNIIQFAPKEMDKGLEFYNTFINKLNPGECIVFGVLTHDIPFIVTVNNLELPLTKDDVLGEKYKFVPVKENLVLVDENGTPVLNTEEEAPAAEIEQPQNEPVPLPEQEDIQEQQQTPVMEKLAENISSPHEEENVQSPQVIEEEAAEEAADEDLSIAEPDEIFEREEELIPENEEEMISDDEFFNEDFPNESTEQNQSAQDSELTEADLDYIEETEDSDIIEEEPQDVNNSTPVVPVYPADAPSAKEAVQDFAQGDTVSHPRYGRGVIEKIIKYGNKTLCSISFDNVGRRLLDPSISEFEKIN